MRESWTRRRSALAAALITALLTGCTAATGTPTGENLPEQESPRGSSYSDRGTQATSTDLILAAREAGEIDDAAALLYRTWLLFGDPQLPDAFVGEPEAHDLGLIFELRDGWDHIPREARAQIQPYLLRPTDPNSAFSTPPSMRAPARALPAATDADAPTCTDWETEAVMDTGYRIWSCADPGALGELTVRQAMAHMELVVLAHYDDMIADMGPLISDAASPDPDPRADGLIDIYLLPAGWLGPPRSTDKTAPDFGVTIGTAPFRGATTSAYILMSADQLADPGLFDRLLTHEMFHVLQYTHHARLSDRWFYDASAEWAASYYARDQSAKLHGVRLPLLHEDTSLSLTDPVGKRPYGAYLWPLFLEQEVGPQAVFDTWRALADEPVGAREPAVIAALGRSLAVRSAFPDFVARLYNADLPGDPIRPRFVDLDNHFPDGQQPEAPRGTLGEGEPLTIEEFAGTPGLGYGFYEVEVTAENDEPVVVTVAGDLTTSFGDHPVLEGLIRGEDGDYRRERIAYGGEGADICVSRSMTLLLANQSTLRADTLSGTITVTRSDESECRRIEVTHPETLMPLTDGAIVQADDIEGDGEPGTAPIVVSVYDIPPGDVDDYRVTVTVTGGTLASAQHFDWPLADFEVLAADGYRKGETIALDRDLTDANRQLRVEATLVRDTSGAGSGSSGPAGDSAVSHITTAELHGEKPCDPAAGEEQCILAGDITFAMKGHSDREVWLSYTESGENAFDVDLHGTLHVRLQETESGDEIPVRHWGDVGSSWEAGGTASFLYCGPGGECGSQLDLRFTPDDADRTGDGPRSLMVALMPYTDGLFLYAYVPVVQEASLSGAHRRPPEPTTPDTWTLGCPGRGIAFWANDDSPRLEFPRVDGSGDWLGWTDSGLRHHEVGTAVVVDCSRTFDIDHGSLSWTLSGTLRWVFGPA